MKKPAPFTVLDRPSQLRTLGSERFDLAVIGGGITGAGIALDAASRGLRTVLLEKGDFASGTSSKSTKLIHGGLRYLKQFDFWLVKEVGSERAIVHQLAPHLVLPEKMLLPLIEGGSYGKWLTSFGLKVYDILAQVTDDDRRRMLEKDEALQREPLLPDQELKGAGYYAEYRTDDARLTLENIKTSLQFGATALNYMRVDGFLLDGDGKICGVRAADLLGGASLEIAAEYVINATGPWVDGLRTLDGRLQGKRLHLTKGVHLVFPYEKLPVRQSIYFDVPDGRMIFAIPRGKVTYVGTTDTDYQGDIDHVKVDLADAVYLLAAVNHMFPSMELELADIESSWAGLRPLIHEEGKSATELSRKDELFTSESGLISIAGGKLTGYRKMAERAVNRVAKSMEESGRVLEGSRTDAIPLCGNGFADFRAVKDYAKKVARRLEPMGFDQARAWELVTTYGIQAEQILSLFDSFSDSDPAWRLLKAELHFGIAHEMVTGPADFFIRRTGRLYFDIGTMKKYLSQTAEACAAQLGTDSAQADAWVGELEALIREHSDFDLEYRSAQLI